MINIARTVVAYPRRPSLHRMMTWAALAVFVGSTAGAGPAAAASSLPPHPLGYQSHRFCFEPLPEQVTGSLFFQLCASVYLAPSGRHDVTIAEAGYEVLYGPAVYVEGVEIADVTFNRATSCAVPTASRWTPAGEGSDCMLLHPGLDDHFHANIRWLRRETGKITTTTIDIACGVLANQPWCNHLPA